MKIDGPADIFSIPVLEEYLLYAPLVSFVSLVNKAAKGEICKLTTSESPGVSPAIEPLAKELRARCLSLPQPKEGQISSPFFLGLVTTRNCNMGCVYCDFAAPKSAGPVMTLSTAKAAIDSYFAILSRSGHRPASVHFFGGEPFFAPEVVDFAVHYSRVKSQSLGIDVKFEVITNGLFDPIRAHWIGDTFHTVVLSLDGPADIQNTYRPGLRGKKIFDQIYATAKILSKSQTNFIVRSCITEDTVERMPEIAEWVARELSPSAWCVEPLTADCSSHTRLRPPDPWKFAAGFCKAARALEIYGIRVVNSTVELGNPRISCCPVGQDAIIVSPDGHLDACYLLEEAWLAKGVNMRIGRIDSDAVTENSLHFQFAFQDLELIRQLNVYNKPLCRDCFCRFSCAGGCHVNHSTDAGPGHYDDLCIYTRLITISKLLRLLGQDTILEDWLSDQENLEASVMQMSDRLAISG